MSGLNGILNIGAGALRTQQTAINVTGHNIANVNTPGYSRQRVNVSANSPLTMKFGQAGTGVNAIGIERSYDRFLNGQINNEIENMGRWQAQSSSLAQVETIFSAGSAYGLDETLNEFWNAWQDLSNNPSGMTERTVLLAKGEGLANAFQEVNTNLGQVQEDLTNSINGATTEINTIAGQIADINRLIGNVEAQGQRANDYRDQRDVLINELSSKIDVTTTEGDNGMMTVRVGNNEVLVEDVRSFDLSFDDPDFTIQTESGSATIDGDDISGGAIRGWLDVRDSVIPGYVNQLNDLAAGIIDSVNTLHVTGTGLDGTQNDFFSGSSASDIAVNSAIVADVNKIAAAGPGGNIPGDNSMAIAIAGLQHQQTMNGNMATFNEFYQSLISDVGSSVQQSATYFTHHKEMASYLDGRREAVSGVNLDEEMVNLVKFQNAYEAAAKIISTVDEMLATVINMV
jgi:flagellar hook-associated protein 1 FlgK